MGLTVDLSHSGIKSLLMGLTVGLSHSGIKSLLMGLTVGLSHSSIKSLLMGLTDITEILMKVALNTINHQIQQKALYA
jgi:hypothetical protein